MTRWSIAGTFSGLGFAPVCQLPRPDASLTRRMAGASASTRGSISRPAARGSSRVLMIRRGACASGAVPAHGAPPTTRAPWMVVRPAPVGCVSSDENPPTKVARAFGSARLITPPVITRCSMGRARGCGGWLLSAKFQFRGPDGSPISLTVGRSAQTRGASTRPDQSGRHLHSTVIFAIRAMAPPPAQAGLATVTSSMVAHGDPDQGWTFRSPAMLIGRWIRAEITPASGPRSQFHWKSARTRTSKIASAVPIPAQRARRAPSHFPTWCTGSVGYAPPPCTKGVVGQCVPFDCFGSSRTGMVVA